MPAELIERKDATGSVETSTVAKAGASELNGDTTPPRAEPNSKPPSKRRFTRRKLLIGVLGAERTIPKSRACAGNP
jgi:hypothetical protein